LNFDKDYVLNKKDMYYTLCGILDGDYYVEDFSDSFLMQELLYYLYSEKLVYIASDNRVLITDLGFNILKKLTTQLI
jgi:hypothetical protein